MDIFYGSRDSNLTLISSCINFEKVETPGTYNCNNFRCIDGTTE